jgi:hypothetical protein
VHKGKLALESEVLDATGDIGEKSPGDKEGLSVVEDDGLLGDNGVGTGLGLAAGASVSGTVGCGVGDDVGFAVGDDVRGTAVVKLGIRC